MTAARPRPTVAVIPDRTLTSNRRLFAALEEAFGVRFAHWRETDRLPDAAIFACAEEDAPAAHAALHGLPALTLVGAADGRRAAEPAADRVLLGDDHAIDRRLRGSVLVDERLLRPLAPAPEEAVLATGAEGPAWTTSEAGGARVDRVRGGLPSLGEADLLRDGLRMSGALALLALVQLLRSITPGWSPPPLRASFVFDDPNLRRQTYGHLDYRRLLAHADEHGYHAAMAMVPLDARRTSVAAVETFRRRPDRLSLAIHGNDHVRDELMQPRTRAEAVALAAQALRRIERFERDTGVGVDRVMMPPHGLCSRPVVGALGELGYEAACAIHPRPWTEVPPPEDLLAGWSPAEFIDGCALLPRFPLTVWPTEIALRAFLDQPLVLYGHHGDLAGGLEPLTEAAARVNAIGDVRWCSSRDIARASCALRLDDDVLVVAPWARTMRVRVPEGVRAVAVAAPPGGTATGFHGWIIDAGPPRPPASFGELVRADGGAERTVSLVAAVRTDPRKIPLPRPRVWPLARRRATEARDRLAPHWPVSA